MLRIHLLLKKNAGKLIVFSLCCIAFLMFNFLIVFADEEEPTTSLPPPASATQPTEFPTDDGNNIIIEQPHNIVAQGGDTISFNVKVSDNSLVDTFLWVYTPDGGLTWNTASSLTGYDTDTLTLIVNRYRAIWKYKCVLNLKDGNVLETRVASIISPSEQATENVTELSTNHIINISDDISGNDLLLIIAVMLLLLIVIAVIRIIL